MDTITAILHELDERTLAREVGIPHDEVRMAFSLRRNTVANFDEFTRVIADYYSHHHAQCIAEGGHMPLYQARSTGTS